MRKTIITLLLVAVTATGYAQTVKSHIVQDGGSGPYKAIVVGDASLPAFTIYRPQDLSAAGKLPILLYANGACANSTVQMRFLLNEVASHGYICVGIGPYEEEDPIENWKNVMAGMYPEGKDVVLANGERVSPPSPEAIKARQEEQQRQIRERESQPANNAEAPVIRQRTYPRQLLEALDWLTDQNVNPESEYYGKLDLYNVAAMGQSCGGSQVLAVAHDPRLTTCILLNSGIGDFSMSGADKSALDNLHTPILYIIGGPTDIAYANAAKDFVNIKNVPVAMINTPPDGHHGTYYEMYGGGYAVAVSKWLDWQLKGREGESALFLDSEYMNWKYPAWNGVHKNF